MKNTNKTNPNLKPVNVKKETLDEGLLLDLSNRSEMFARGFVHNDIIYIKQLADTTPKTLAEFGDNMKASGSVFFYVLELDDEKRRARGLWVCSSKNLIICQVSHGRCVPWFRPCNDYKHATPYNSNFSHFETFWRKGDYEEARKCARRIFCIYQNDHSADIIAKQEQREKAKEWAVVRHTVLECSLSFDPSRQLNRVTTLKTRTDLGETSYLVGGGRWGYSYYYSSDFKYKDKDDALAHYFDASGYYIKDRAELMRQRTDTLKRQRARDRLQKYGFTVYADQLRNLYASLVGSFKELSDKFLDLTARHVTHRVFYFCQRLEKTADALHDVSETIERIEGKSYDGDDALLKDYDAKKEHAQKVLAKNRVWLDISDDNRKDKDNLEDYAVYYGYCEYLTDGSGNINKCVLDLEKAKQELARRGY